MDDNSHIDALYREAQQRQINAMHLMAEVVERNAAALQTMQPPADRPRFEYRRQAGSFDEGYQPVTPGEGWEIMSWYEDSDAVVYLWRRLILSP